MTGVLDLNDLSPEDNKQLNELAVEIRDEFNALVEQVGLAHEAAIDWIVSSIASRNKYLSPLFERCCQLALVDSFLRSGRQIGEVRTTDRALSGVLAERFRKRGLPVSVTCTETLRSRVKRTVTPFYHFVWACVLLSLRCAGRSRRAQRQLRGNGPITLLDTFVLKSKVGEGGSIFQGKYRDRYYPGLLAGVSEEVRTSIFYCPGFLGFRNPLEAFRLVRRSTDRFIIPDDSLKISDYLYCLAYPVRVLRLGVPAVKFRGYDVTPALKQERWLNCCNEASLLGLLNYRFAFRVSEANIPVRLLVDWHENQPLDRGLIVGFRRFQPGTLITGYQGYIVATNLHLYVRPTAQESRVGAAPDRLAVIGRGLVKEVQELSPGCEPIVAPAFRFAQVWKPRVRYPDPDAFTVLVALPIGLKGSRAIVELVTLVQRTGRLPGVRFWLKPHPTVRPERVEEWLDGEYLDGESIKTGRFDECIEGADVLVGNASSTCVEALAKGVPVIVVGVKLGINENPIPSAVPDDMWRLCTTAGELIDGLEFFRSRKKTAVERYHDVSQRIREDYFEPVTEEGIRLFLQIEGGDSISAASN